MELPQFFWFVPVYHGSDVELPSYIVYSGRRHYQGIGDANRGGGGGQRGILLVLLVENAFEEIDGYTHKGLTPMAETVAAQEQVQGINNNYRGLCGGIQAIGIDDNRGSSRGRGIDDEPEGSAATTEAVAGQHQAQINDDNDGGVGGGRQAQIIDNDDGGVSGGMTTRPGD